MDVQMLKQILEQEGLVEQFSITQEMLKKLAQYADFMLEWNTKVNLTRITEPTEVAEKHFADSLLLLRELHIPQNAALIDVGTGAGFPSMPCKIVRSDLHITLLDSLNKRISFLDALAKEMNLTVQTIHGRAEEVGRKPEFRECYDVATARAVSHLRELSEYCLPFVKVGGVFAAMKGKEIEPEVEEARSAIEKLGGEIAEIRNYQLSDGSERSIVVVRKISQIAAKYPRPSAKMKKFQL